MPKETVANRSTHVVDLADGRTLTVGAVASGVDMSDPHNATLAEAGALHVVSSRKTTTKKGSKSQVGEDEETTDTEADS